MKKAAFYIVLSTACAGVVFMAKLAYDFNPALAVWLLTLCCLPIIFGMYLSGWHK